MAYADNLLPRPELVARGTLLLVLLKVLLGLEVLPAVLPQPLYLLLARLNSRVALWLLVRDPGDIRGEELEGLPAVMATGYKVLLQR